MGAGEKPMAEEEGAQSGATIVEDIGENGAGRGVTEGS